MRNAPPFYGTQRFINAVTGARHLSLSCASSIQNSVQYITEYTVYNLVKLIKNSQYENEINYENIAGNAVLTVLSHHHDRILQGTLF
jgi:hypothetical protein